MKKHFLLILVILFLWGCEQQGIVDIDNCVETIKLKEGDFKSYIGTFTCMLDETNKEGVHKGGLCAKVKINDNNQCRKAYIYKKEPSLKCDGDRTYLADSGNCECISNMYEWNRNKTDCVKKQCPANAELRKEDTEYYWQDSEYKCFCKDGFKLTEDKTGCVNNKSKPTQQHLPEKTPREIIEEYISLIGNYEYEKAFALLGENKQKNSGGSLAFRDWVLTIESIDQLQINEIPYESSELEKVYSVKFLIEYEHSDTRETTWKFFMRPRGNSWEIFRSY